MPRTVIPLLLATLLVVSGCTSKPKQNSESAQSANTADNQASTTPTPQPTPPNAEGTSSSLPATPPAKTGGVAKSSQAPPPKSEWKPEQEGSKATTTVKKPVPLPPVVVPEGTTVTVRLSQAIDSKKNKAGDTFEGTVTQPVVSHGQTLVPQSSPVTGTVVEAAAPGKLKGEGRLSIKLNSIRIRGVSYPITTATVSNTIHGKGKRSATMIGGGTGVGALIGGIAGGGKGAAIGAVVGGGAGTAGATMTGNQQLAFTAESALTFKLLHALTLKPASAGTGEQAAEQHTNEPQLQPR